MSQYQLVDIEGNLWNIPLPNFKRSDDKLKVNIESIDRSYKAGSVKIGESRDEKKELSFEYDYWDETDSNFISTMNELIMWLRKAVKIRDLTNLRETDIHLSDHDFAYTEGGYLRLTKNEISFEQLTPYWWDIDYKTATLISGDSNIIIDNQGFVETPPIITVSAITTTSKFSIKIQENNRGILIQDFDFSLNGLNTYIIDCSAGSAILEGLKRNNKIKNGTGPFFLIPGINTIEIQANGLIDVVIQYKQRYYL